MKNTPRGCLTAGGAKPPRVTPYISIQLVSLCKHSNSGSGAPARLCRLQPKGRKKGQTAPTSEGGSGMSVSEWGLQQNLRPFWDIINITFG